MTLTKVGAAYVEYIRAIAVKAARCEALTITTACEQCGQTAQLERFAKRDGCRLELCSPCFKRAD